MTTTTLTQRQVKNWLIKRIVQILQIAPEDVSSHAVFSELGMSSLQAVELAAELENWSGREIPATIVYEYPTIEDASTYVIGLPAIRVSS
jgi:acyl carrier protein